MRAIMSFEQFCDWPDSPGRKVYKITEGLYGTPSSTALGGRWEQ